MTHRIQASAPRTLAVLVRAMAAFLHVLTGGNRKRAGRGVPVTPTGKRLIVRVFTPPPMRHFWTPPPRPYARAATVTVPAFGDEVPTLAVPGPLVRSYLVAYEQWERRRALALALDGIDVGPLVIHGHRVGSPASGVAV